MTDTTTVSKSTLASMLLRDLNAPDNAATNLAVVTWLNHESGSKIVGNNPLNIHYDNAVAYGLNPSGKWYSSGDGTYVAQFSSLDAGMAATAKFLTGLTRYQSSVASLRANDPVGFLNNIARSGWSECQYGLVTNSQNSRCHGDGQTNELLVQYRGATIAGASGTATLTGGNNDSAGVPTLADLLGKDGTLTLDNLPATIAAILATPQGAAYVKANGTDLHTYLVDFVGHKFSDIPFNVSDPSQNLDQTGPSSSGSGYPTLPGADILGTAGDILNWLADPAHWLYILTTAIGVAMTGYGLITLTRAYGAPIPSPVP